MSKLDELETAYVSLVRAGVQPSEIWNMTWPEYMVLQIAASEEATQQGEPGEDRSNIIHCDSIEDFALALSTARGRIE